VDLADGAHGLQMARKIRPANRGADRVSAFGECRDGMAPDEARAAKYRDQVTVARHRLTPCAKSHPKLRQ
jgi:hypothetical protein